MLSLPVGNCLVRSMPTAVRTITYFLPARYYVALLQTVFLAGDVWSVLLPNSAALIAMMLKAPGDFGDSARAKAQAAPVVPLGGLKPGQVSPNVLLTRNIKPRSSVTADQRTTDKPAP